MSTHVTTWNSSTILIHGVGLLGGSIAKACRARGVGKRIIGTGRDRVKLESAVSAGWLDGGFSDLGQLESEQIDLTVICTPVDRITTDLSLLARHLKHSGLITDVGSTKEQICRLDGVQLPAHLTFVGSHPLAGSEKQGLENAQADLFQGRLTVVTPKDEPNEHERAAMKSVIEFWQAIGSRTLCMSPKEHDEALARTSHLPHLVSSVLAFCVDDNYHHLTGTGFRDTTRIAAGDPALWTAIVKANRQPILDALGEYAQMLELLTQMIENDDAVHIKDFLANAQEMRLKLTSRGDSHE